MKPAFVESVKYFCTAGAVFVAGAISSYLFRSPVPQDGWSAFGAVATGVGVLAAVGIYYGQRKDAAERVDVEDAALLLSLQQVAREIASMCNLAGFQHDSDSNPILYPDVSEEFLNLSTMLSGLPVDRIAAHGKLQSVLHLRRIAIQMSVIWSGSPPRDGSTFRNNRTRIDELTFSARRESLAIAEYLKGHSPRLYAIHQSDIHKL